MTMTRISFSDFLLIGGLLSTVSAQVCSPPGQLCTKTTDCCKGCCEAHTCVDRAFSCSPDLIQQPSGHNSCIGYFCPLGHICYLREVCPPENPCPPLPSCRKVDMARNYSDSLQQHRNFSPRTSPSPVCIYLISSAAIFVTSLLTMR